MLLDWLAVVTASELPIINLVCLKVAGLGVACLGLDYF